jgi:hypothetical protein
VLADEDVASIGPFKEGRDPKIVRALGRKIFG